MTTEIIFLALRVLSAVFLLGALAALFAIFWGRSPARPAETAAVPPRRTFGRVQVLYKDGDAFVPSGTPAPLLPLTSIGRSPANTITIEDSFASGEHALLALRDGQWWLEDRESRNGTLLNDLPVLQPMIVTDGDMIAIGSTHLRLELDPTNDEDDRRYGR